MNRMKRYITALILLVGVTQLMAEPQAEKKCCNPMPVGGMKALARNIVYPTFDRIVRNNADVILSFHVDIQGNVSDIRVTQSGGSNFDRSAVNAVLNTQWKPAMQNGIPVALTYAIPFEYRYK